MNARKLFNKPDDAPPFPMFINAVDVVGLGADIMLDLGNVSVEAVNIANASGSTPPVVDMFVLARFGMSLVTAKMLHQRLEMILSQIPKEPVK